MTLTRRAMGGQGKENQGNDDGDVAALSDDTAVGNDTDPDVATDQASYEASLPTQTTSAVIVDFTGAATPDDCDQGCDPDSPPIATFTGASEATVVPAPDDSGCRL